MFLREAVDIPLTMVRQYQRPATIERRKLRWLNEMLRYSVERVPFYRAEPAYARPPLRTPADLAAVPVLRKETLRALPPRTFVAEGVDTAGCMEFHTSGSTGKRVVGWHDWAAHDYHMAACFRRFMATNRYLPTHRMTHIRGYVAPRRGFERFKLFRRHTILCERPTDEIVAEILATRPHVLGGCPVHLRRVLRAMTPDGMTRLRRTLRMLLPDSELITPEMRDLLQDGFGVPLFDEYSAFEVLNVYFECAKGGRHLAEDRVHVEIVDDEDRPLPDGQEGHVVVTAFMERAMPLIRYALGDIGVIDPEPCACGRTFRTMRLTKGRHNDVVTLPDGRQLYSDTFWSFATYFPGIVECFVEQDTTGRVRFNVVPADPATDLDLLFERVRAEMFRVAGGPFDLEVVAADEMPITAAGKGQAVVSSYPARA